MVCNPERSDRVEGDFSETTINTCWRIFFCSSPCVSLLNIKRIKPNRLPEGVFPESITRTCDHLLIATDERRDLILMLISFLAESEFWISYKRGGEGAALPAPMQGASLR